MQIIYSATEFPPNVMWLTPTRSAVVTMYIQWEYTQSQPTKTDMKQARSCPSQKHVKCVVSDSLASGWKGHQKSRLIDFFEVFGLWVGVHFPFLPQMLKWHSSGPLFWKHMFKITYCILDNEHICHLCVYIKGAFLPSKII